jgi:uncharacterized protein
MEFEWSEPKRLIVLQARAIDFVPLAEALLDGRPVVTAPSPRDGEDRFVTVGLRDGEFFAIVWTWRKQAVRIITARRARDAERRRYRAVHG